MLRTVPEGAPTAAITGAARLPPAAARYRDTASAAETAARFHRNAPRPQETAATLRAYPPTPQQYNQPRTCEQQDASAISIRSYPSTSKTRRATGLPLR
jgi:hypothetical protein